MAERTLTGDAPDEARDAFWKSWACGHPRRQRQERQPWQKCIPCANADKQARKYIAGHIALIVIQVVLGLFMVGGSR